MSRLQPPVDQSPFHFAEAAREAFHFLETEHDLGFAQVGPLVLRYSGERVSVEVSVGRLSLQTRVQIVQPTESPGASERRFDLDAALEVLELLDDMVAPTPIVSDAGARQETRRWAALLRTHIGPVLQGDAFAFHQIWERCHHPSQALRRRWMSQEVPEADQELRWYRLRSHLVRGTRRRARRAWLDGDGPTVLAVLRHLETELREPLTEEERGWVAEGDVRARRESLGFAETVQELFAFLVKEYGFRLAQVDLTFVRYESDRVFVQLYHGRMSFAVAMELGLLRAPTDKYEDTWTPGWIQWLAERGQPFESYVAVTPEVVREHLSWWAQLTRERLTAVLRGDPAPFARLREEYEKYTAERRRQEAAERANPNYERNRWQQWRNAALKIARERAERAWAQGDFQGMLEELAYIEAEVKFPLTDEERARREVAEARLAQYRGR
jgi:hypothetical protein